MLRDIIFNHPEYLAMAVLAWAAVAIWILSLIGWMIQGDIEVAFGLPAIAVAIVLGYWTFMPPAPYMRFVSMASVVGIVIVYPALRRMLNARQLAAIDIEMMENAYAQLAKSPDNPMARFKLARVLYDRGQIEASLSVAAETIKQMPEKLFLEEHRIFGRWKRNHRDVQIGRPIICLDCAYANPPERIYCYRCNRPYLIDIARGRWIGRDSARKLLAGWLAGIAALAGIPYAATMPAAISIPIILTITFGALALLVIAFRAGSKVRA